MTDTPLPEMPAISSLLGDLLGRAVNVSASGSLDNDAMRAVGTFATDELSPCAFFACDLHTAVFAASALSLVPAAAAQQAISAGELNATLKENLAEILNVCSQLFRGTGGQRVAFVELIHELTDETASTLGGAKTTIDLTIDVGGYGKGQAKLGVF